MASPFRVFRKYQKALLVAAGVVLMFVFVIGDALVPYLGGSRGGSGASRDAGAVAVNWDGGSLTNQELDNLVMRRRIVNSFLQRVEYAGRLSAVEAGVEPRELRVQPMLGPPTERGVVATKMFADAAREAGMHVSDEAIVRYLDELGRGHVSRDQMRALITQGGARVPISYVMDALREEMLAHNYLASHKYAFATVTPQQRYLDWLRVNDRVVVEAAAIPAESFVVDVPDPTEPELATFFEEHKLREPQPDLIGQVEFPSPVPGFRLPRKIDVQFIQAEYDQLLAKIENEITEAEIAKYYEDNKDPLFIKADTGFLDSAPQDQGTNTPAGDSPATGTQPATESTPAAEADDDSGASTPSATETPAESNPPAGAAQPPAGNAEPGSTPATDDQSSIQHRPGSRVFRLAAFLQQPESGGTPAGSGAASKAPTDSPGQPAAAAGAPPDETSQPATDAKPSASGESAAASTGGESTSATAPPTGAAPASNVSSTAESEQPKEFQPLDEVRDEIRRTLAVQRASQQLNDLMSQLQVQVNGEFTKYFSERLAAETEGREPPAPPQSLIDLAPLAAQHGLKHGTTGPMSWLELRKTPVGASGDLESQTELYRVLFATEDVEMHQPISTEDVDGNRFLAMKMSDAPGRIPELAEVRDEVVRAWKLQKAAELAKKRAEELAKKAQDAKEPLSQALADSQNLEVIRTDPFSRYTGGDVVLMGGQPQLQPFRLSEPTGIVAAGPEFMDAVFNLKDGEVGSVLNHDHSIAYIVRVAEHQQTPDALHDAYLAEANIWPGLGIMLNEHQQLGTQLLASDIFAGRALKWRRHPDQQEPAEVE